MRIAQSKWCLKREWEEDKYRALSSQWKLSPLLVKLLLNRGIQEDSVQQYLFPSFSTLHDPFLMDGIEKAVQLILSSIHKKQKILVYGDFDVDGITATSLLLKFMRDLKFSSYYYIPHRQNEGYGLNREAIKKASTKDVKLIITCDCGTSSLEEIQFARSLGLEVIVTDHHQVREKLPSDFIILNPHKPGCSYPFKELAGVGVAFKLCQTIAREINFPVEKVKRYLDLVAMGTLADMVPLSGENRTLVKLGLEKFPSHATSLGLRALINTTGLSGKSIEEGAIGYILAPRLNACGRLSLAKNAVKLLLTRSTQEALSLSRKLNRENSRRQNMEKRMCREAEKILSGKIDHILVAASRNWHPGVIGLVASYLKEKYHRPAIAFAVDKDTARGSARSIPGFSIFDALAECSHLLTSFGGHEMAAGLTLPPHSIQKLTQQLNSMAKRMLSPEDFIPCRFFDAEFPLNQINAQIIREIQILSPFGLGNPKPVFLARGAKVLKKYNIKKGKKFVLTDAAEEKRFEALSFNHTNKKDISPGKVVDLLYFPKLNTWRGKETIQLDIKEMRQGSDLDI